MSPHPLLAGHQEINDVFECKQPFQLGERLQSCFSEISIYICTPPQPWQINFLDKRMICFIAVKTIHRESKGSRVPMRILPMHCYSSRH